jgi:uncharacterized NAD(P)/FAD-binding protein YdhS
MISTKKVLIIGGGFSGMMIAINLIMNEDDALITIINDTYEPPLGAAYSTKNNVHLLNVPAGKMSAFANKPSDFIDWLKSKKEYRHLLTDSIENEFVSRTIYGAYLTDIFENYKSHPKINWINGTANDINITSEGYDIILKNNERYSGNILILASGNMLPSNPPIKNETFYYSKNYFRNPWNDSFLNTISRNKPILIIGTGLTMIDCLLSLKSIQFKEKIYAISPRGYIPKSHTKVELYPDFYSEIKGHTLLTIFKTVRKHIKIAEEKNIPWQSVIDSLRPYVQDIWKSFADKEKLQFISHVRHIWGVARHRLPQHIHSEIEQLIKTGQLEIIGGRINNIIETNDNELNVEILLRKQKNNKTIKASCAINCTGPQTNYNEIENELYQNLIRKKIILPDTNRLGIKATTNYEVLKSENTAYKNMYAIGSLLRGVLWETTAIPELKQQAYDIAQQIKSDN